MGTVLTVSCFLLLSTPTVEGDAKTLLIETKDGGKEDYSNTIGTNNGYANQVSDYQKEVDDYQNIVPNNFGSVNQFTLNGGNSLFGNIHNDRGIISTGNGNHNSIVNG